MSPAIIAYAPAIIGLIGIGLFVIIRGKNAMNVLFSLMLGSVALWLLLLLASSLLIDGAGLLVLRAGIFVSNLMPYFFILFAFAFPGGRPLSTKKALLLAIPVAVFCVLSLSPDMIRDVQVDPQGLSPVIHTGYLYTLQAIFIVGYLFIGLGAWGRKFFRARNAEQKQEYTLLFVAFLFPLIVNFLIGYVFIDNTWLQLFAPSSLLVTAGLLAYSIIKHRLFDIRGLVIRAVVNLVLLGLISLVYVMLILNVGTGLLERFGMSQGRELYYTAATLLIAVSFAPLNRLFRRLTNKIFFRDEYSPQDVLDEISSLLTQTVNLASMMRSVLKTLEKAFKPEFMQLLIVNSEGDAVRYATTGKQRTLLDKLPSLLDAKKTILVSDELHGTHEARHYLQAYNVAVVMQLKISKTHLAYLSIGYKQSGYAYSKADIYLMSIVGEQLTVGLQNQLRFQEIEEFNATLRKRVDEATLELRDSNKKLKSLDQAKDEFISMASHQLRTPLTSVKGYVSMVLEGDAGKLNPTQHQLLEQAFASSQRMVYLISDFLNVSRLQTGKFTIERTPINLADVVTQEVHQLQSTAQSRGLRIEANVPSSFPTLSLDESKLRQAIMNFIDNAIFYSRPAGVIKVDLVKTAKELVLTVQDQGIGVPPNERHHLFTKFYRASNARTARPDGTGIGLFMAKKVVVAHGGSIVFNSVEGKGSTFGFRLPLSHSSTSDETKKFK